MRQTKARITNRQKDGAISVLDGFRVAALDKALADGSAVRVPEFNSALWNICKTCAADVTTSLTLGILQDLLEFVALSNTSPMRSLDHQIAQKIAPQLVGPAAVVRQLLTVVTAMVDANCDFSHARVALEQLLKHEDRGTGLIVSRY